MYLVPDDRSSTSGGCVITADFNNDGKPDIALHFLGASNGLVMLRNTTGAVPAPVPSAPTLLSPANDAIVPNELTDTLNRTIRITMPEGLTGPSDASR